MRVIKLLKTLTTMNWMIMLYVCKRDGQGRVSALVRIQQSPLERITRRLDAYCTADVF